MIELSRIPWKTVDSTQFTGIWHDTTLNLLYVKFNRNQVWTYENVSLWEYNEMLSSVSIGKYFHENIKNYKFATKLKDGNKSEK